MLNEKNLPASKRSVGHVKWYGGRNGKTNRDNQFGFLISAEHGDLHVHESALICAPSDMKVGRWVTFRVKEGKKGASAVDVDLAENESDSSTITKVLETSEIPIEIRVKACFCIPLVETHPLIPSLQKTIEEYDRHDLRGIRDFPDSWKEVNCESPLYKILPKQNRLAWFNRVYPGIKQTIDVLSKSEGRIERSTEIYSSMSPQDRQLALIWTGAGSNYEKAKMLSARGAELIATKFLTEIGGSVIDIAIHQVTGESDQWRSHDLLVDSMGPVDVKNARTTINSNTFVEYTIKRFKQDSLGRNVIIFGVLSPYLTLEELENRWLRNRDSPQILGTTTHSQVRDFEEKFSKGELTVDFGDSRRWPIWIFHNDLNWFSDQLKAISKFSDCSEQVKPEAWRECQINVFPAFLCAGKKMPTHYRNRLLPWQNRYLEKVAEKSRCGVLTLPWLYLFTFSHFLKAITNIDSAESMQYSPPGYNELLFYSEKNSDRPASLLDPVRVLKKLIETLIILWDHRHSAHLGSLRSFILRGEGLLVGIDPQGRKVSVLAYCGGFIEGKGKCGHSPLVIGIHKTCTRCQKLICGKCGYCDERCDTKGM